MSDTQQETKAAPPRRPPAVSPRPAVISASRRRRRLIIALSVTAVIAFLAVDGAWGSLSLARSLHHARNELQAGADAFKAGDLTGAASLFQQAEADAKHAESSTGHPSIALAALLPVFGDDVRAIRAVTHASVWASRAGQDVVRAAQGAGWTGTGFPGGEQGGVVDLDAVRRATPALVEAARDANRARGILAAIDPGGLIGPIRRPFQTAVDTLTDQSTAVSSAASLAQLLPGFLGGDGPRRYLLAFQNLSDARGSGGFMGSYGILEADQGRVSLGPIGSLADLKQAPQVTGFPDVERRYGPYGGTIFFDSANYSPDFPTASRVLLQMWRNDGRGILDGVIAVDPVWMSRILSVIGPITIPEWPEPLTGDNIVTALLHDTFLSTDQRYSNALQGALGGALWQGLIGRPLPTHGLGDAMARSVRERHFQVFSTRPQEEGLLSDLGAAGSVHLGSNPLFVVRDDEIDNRSGWFAHATVGYDIALQTDGSADVSIYYTLHNTAPPDAPPSILLGWRPGEPRGIFGSGVSFYLPEGATNVKTHVGGDASLAERGQEFGHPVVEGHFEIGPGRTAPIHVTYHAPHAAVEENGTFVYRAKLIPQAKLWPVPVTVRITLPEGADVQQTGWGMERTDSALTYRAADISARTIWVSYRR
ncbi:MAG: DUF4012 domain-containing protein [Actinomycetota bacterium]